MASSSINDTAIDGTILLAKQPSIIRQLELDHAPIVALLNYNRRGTILYLAANNVLRGYSIAHNFHVPYKSYDDGVKVWRDYKDIIDHNIAEMVKKLKNIDSHVFSEELNPARKALTTHIYQEYFKKLPKWPQVGRQQSAVVDMNITGSYKTGGYYIVWSCVGSILIVDKRPAADTYEAEFTGEAKLKTLFIDNDKLFNLERSIQGLTMVQQRQIVDNKELEFKSRA